MSASVRRTDTFLRSVSTALLLAAAGPFAFAQSSFESDQRAAEAGESKAMTALAHRYEHGQGCPRDAGQAILWYRRAARLNEPGAMVALGNIYDEGKCVDQDMGEAMRWYRLAAKFESGEAMYQLGRMIQHGRGVRADRDEAIGWYEKAAGLGNAPAMTALGDLKADAQWYRKAVDAGDARAFAKLASKVKGDEARELYRKGAELGDPAAIYEFARIENRPELYLRAAEAGHPAAMSRYAQIAEARDSPGEALVWYTKAADAGDPAGLTWLARRTEAKSAESAHALYERAVAAGYVPAMTRLGVLRADCAMMRRAAELGDADGMFEYAQRCRPDNANEWYGKAAALNHPNALAQIGETKRAAAAGHLASMLALGRTDPEWLRRAADAGEPEAMRLFAATLNDPGDAARWYTRAAEAGDAAAMSEIGRRFEKGVGVATDRQEALKWYRQGAEKGDRTAMYRLGLLSSDMSWIRKAADAELPEAMCKLGESFDDREKALALFRKAADSGYANGWTRIAAVTGDAALLAKAAQSGDAEAKLRLGEIEYQRNRRREACRMFRAAADSGYAPAMVRAGDCHLEGEGASRSEVDAVNWYRKAALAGDRQAAARLQKLGKSQ